MGAEWQNRRHVDPNWYVGKGKAEELLQAKSETGFDILVADDELSPGQQKSLEWLLNVKVIDRSRLILDIFALHAQTHEGRLQVELAQLEYQLPRLTRLWTHLSRTQGGIGSRGPGESQLETDRRIIRERIKKMKARVEDVRQQRETTARGRDRRLYPTVAIVGYTNAGKSTLLNSLVGSEVAKAEDKLFATLDPTSRQVKLGDGQTAIVTDTVGFIHKLPHQLVDAFRATLEEVTRADVLVEVVDASDAHSDGAPGDGPDRPRRARRRRQAAPDRVQQGRPAVPGRGRRPAGAGGRGLRARVRGDRASGWTRCGPRSRRCWRRCGRTSTSRCRTPRASCWRGSASAAPSSSSTASGPSGCTGGWRRRWPASCARSRAAGRRASPRRAWRPERRGTLGSSGAPAPGRTATGGRVWWTVADGPARAGAGVRRSSTAAASATRCCSRRRPTARSATSSSRRRPGC